MFINLGLYKKYYAQQFKTPKLTYELSLKCILKEYSCRKNMEITSG